MKKQRHRPGLLTKVYRMCYTSTFGFFIFTILNDYTNANNETLTVSQGNTTTPEYHVLTRNTWLSGFNDCKDIHNFTMASAEDVRDRDEGYNFTSEIEKYLPVWTYAFEITMSSGKTFRINSNDVSSHKNTYKCLATNGSVFQQCCLSLINARNYCKGQQTDLVIKEIHPQELDASYGQRIYINTTSWTKVRNESEFVNENGDLSVRCLLLDENGELRTDNCNEQHKTLCIPDTSKPVFQYVDKLKIPHYTPSTTKRQSTGRSSHFTKSPDTSKHDSNNTKSTPVSINTITVPAKPGFMDDPQIRYSVIGVGCFIVLAILVAVCCCCCRNRRSRENNKRKSAHLADAYSETADSIVMKETSVYETADTSEYAIPEDALKKARHRKSIGENEYDVLQKPNKTQNKFTGNAYSHVTLVSSKERRGSSNQEENTYDVTNYGKQNSVIVSPNDITGNVYGDVALKTESKLKTESTTKTESKVKKESAVKTKR